MDYQALELLGRVDERTGMILQKLEQHDKDINEIKLELASMRGKREVRSGLLSFAQGAVIVLISVLADKLWGCIKP